jgi:Sigma-70, region 4
MLRTGVGLSAVLAMTIAPSVRADQLPVVGQVPVPVPTVQSLPGPTVQSLPPRQPVPSLPAPQVPSTPKLPSVPSAPTLPSGSGGSAPTTSGGSSASPGGGSGPAGGGASGSGSAGQTGTGSGGSGSSGGVAGVAASGGGTAAPSSAAGGGSAAARQRAAASRRRERRLRTTVRETRGCLGALPALTRRVLVLRSGLGPARPHSRRSVAAILDLPVRRVRRTERRGLRRLRRMDRQGRCDATARGVLRAGSGPMVLRGVPPDAGHDVRAVAASNHTPSATGDRVAAGKRAATSDRADAEPGRGEVKGETASLVPIPAEPSRGPNGAGFTLPLAAVLLLAVTAIAGRAVWRAREPLP